MPFGGQDDTLSVGGEPVGDSTPGTCFTSDAVCAASGARAPNELPMAGRARGIRPRPPPHVIAAATARIQGFRVPEPSLGGRSFTASNPTVVRGAAPTDASIVISEDYR